MPSNSASRYARYFGACLGLTFFASLVLALARGTFAPDTELVQFRLASRSSIHREILATSVGPEDATATATTTTGSSSSPDCGTSPCAAGTLPLIVGQKSPEPQSAAISFEAVPWLLPPRHPELPYSDVHNLDALAALRAQRKGGYNTITVAFFSRGMVDLLQNCIYSMVKFGRVENYIVAVWTEEDLEACKDLNLPCADVREHMPRPLGPEPMPSPSPETEKETKPSSGAEDGENNAAAAAANATSAAIARHLSASVPEFESRDHNTIMWTKPAVVHYLVKKGYAVHSTDIDIAYAPKDVWASYLNLLDVSGADGAFQIEAGHSPINSGNYVVLPTERMQELMDAWMAQGKTKGVDNGGNQKGLRELYDKGAFKTCHSVAECQEVAQARLKATLDGGDLKKAALIRTYDNAGWEVHHDYCAFSGYKYAPNISPCASSVMYVHPICTSILGVDWVLTKIRVLRESGFWFMDGGGLRAGACARDKNESSSDLPRCVPLDMKWPQAHVEAEFEACDNLIAFT